jgi:hypothetical protein
MRNISEDLILRKYIYVNLMFLTVLHAANGKSVTKLEICIC